MQIRIFKKMAVVLIRINIELSFFKDEIDKVTDLCIDALLKRDVDLLNSEVIIEFTKKNWKKTLALLLNS